MEEAEKKEKRAKILSFELKKATPLHATRFIRVYLPGHAQKIGMRTGMAWYLRWIEVWSTRVHLLYYCHCDAALRSYSSLAKGFCFCDSACQARPATRQIQLASCVNV